MRLWKKWKFKNLTLFFTSIVIAVFVSQSSDFHYFLHHIGKLSYIGAFIAGMLYVSTFTVATGAVILLFLSDTASIWELSFIAALGSLAGDFLIFRFVKDNLSSELELVYDQIDAKHHIQKLLHTKYFSWTLPVLGALIIASPFPDELGVSLLGISKMSVNRFLVLAFILDFLGIFALILAAKLIVN